MLDAMADRHPWWFPQGAKGLAWDYFVYGTDFLPLGAAGSATAALTNPININSDSAFLIVSGALVETDTANTTFLAQRPLLCSLQEGGSGRTLNNTPIHVDNWFGTAELPKIWEQPKLLVPNSTFNVTLTNLEATARNIRIAFHGFKLFGFVP
jgi:hypothetical protein